MNRRAALALIAAAPTAAFAHHGYMNWDRENLVILEGWISKELDGFPHWEILVRVDGVDWEVDVGDQFQLERVGLDPKGSDFPVRRKIRVEGWRPEDRKILRILPERVILDGDKVYELKVRE